MISLILAIITMPSLYLLSIGKRSGWIWGMALQLPWGVYGCLTHQLGLVLLAAAYVVINAKGLAYGSDGSGMSQ